MIHNTIQLPKTRLTTPKIKHR